MAARRFLNGLSSVAGTDPLANFPYLDPTKYAWYYQDYFSPHFGAALANGNATYDGIYYVSTAATGTIDVAAHARANGVLTMTIGDADNVACSGFAVAPSMRLHSGNKFFMSTKFMITLTGAGAAVPQQELFIGLCSDANAHTTVFNAAGNAVVVDDHIGWILLDGTASFYFDNVENDAGDVVDTTMDVADTTWYEMAVYYDGTTMYLWGQAVYGATPPHMRFNSQNYLGSWTASAIPVSQVGPAITFKTGEAKGRTLYVDYLFAACERG